MFYNDPTKLNPEKMDPKTLYFVYYQAVDEIISGNQPVAKEHAIQLAALQLHVDQAELTKENYIFYIPDPIIKKEKKMEYQDWKNELDGPLSKLADTDRTGAMHRYLRFTRQWCAYGASFFKAKQINKPYNVILAAHWSGLFVLAPGERKPLFSYRYSAILSWSPSASAFNLKIGNMTNAFEMKFFTSYADQIMLIFQAYVDMLITRTQSVKQQQMVKRARERQQELEAEGDPEGEECDEEN